MIWLIRIHILRPNYRKSAKTKRKLRERWTKGNRYEEILGDSIRARSPGRGNNSLKRIWRYFRKRHMFLSGIVVDESGMEQLAQISLIKRSLLPQRRFERNWIRPGKAFRRSDKECERGREREDKESASSGDVDVSDKD